MFKRIVTGALVFGMAALAPPALVSPAAAQVICAPRALVTERLTRLHDETLLVQGFASDGIIEFWVSVARRGWTLLLTRPDGAACIIGAGVEWAPAPAAAANAGAAPEDGF